jgi:hypothetical protein
MRLIGEKFVLFRLFNNKRPTVGAKMFDHFTAATAHETAAHAQRQRALRSGGQPSDRRTPPRDGVCLTTVMERSDIKGRSQPSRSPQEASSRNEAALQVEYGRRRSKPRRKR